MAKKRAVDIGPNDPGHTEKQKLLKSFYRVFRQVDEIARRSEDTSKPAGMPDPYEVAELSTAVTTLLWDAAAFDVIQRIRGED